MSAKAVAPAIFAVVLLTSMNTWAGSRGLERPKPTALWSPNDSGYNYKLNKVIVGIFASNTCSGMWFIHANSAMISAHRPDILQLQMVAQIINRTIMTIMTTKHEQTSISHVHIYIYIYKLNIYLSICLKYNWTKILPKCTSSSHHRERTASEAFGVACRTPCYSRCQPWHNSHPSSASSIVFFSFCWQRLCPSRGARTERIPVFGCWKYQLPGHCPKALIAKGDKGSIHEKVSNLNVIYFPSNFNLIIFNSTVQTWFAERIEWASRSTWIKVPEN